jgi:TRAP-type C4-dicarboxylate transport system permease small subunit
MALNDDAKDSDTDLWAEKPIVQRSAGLVSNLAGALLAAIVVISLIGVVGRYVLNLSVPWTEELPRILLVWLTFVGAVIATVKKRHIRVDTLLERLKDSRAGRIVEIGVISVSIVALSIWAWVSLPLLGESSHTVMPATGIRIFWSRIALPVACVLMVIYLVIHLLDVIRGKRFYQPLDTDDLDAMSRGEI